jgi:hypothetical protein
VTEPGTVDELVLVPPESFVAARDALAKELRASGDSDGAATVKAMRKPTVVQWLTTLVRHEHVDVVTELRRASKSVADAQEAAITKGDRDELRIAITRRRNALQALERAVDEVFATTGRQRSWRDDVVTAVETATTEEVATGTFGVRDDLDVSDVRPRPRKPKPDPLRERRITKARESLTRAEAAVERARTDLGAAESALAAARAHYDEVVGGGGAA